MTKIPFKKGDLVKGVPGRLSHDWHGTVVEADTSHVNTLIHVHWSERENWPETEEYWQKIRKQPVTAYQVGWLMFQDGRTVEWTEGDNQPVQVQAPTSGQISIGETRVEAREQIRLIVAGCRWFQDYELLCTVLDKLLAKKMGVADVEIVSGLANGADTLGGRYSKERGLGKPKEFPADWDEYGKGAGHIRNEEMAKYATHCVVFWDEESAGTRNMIERAKAHDLKLRIVKVEKRPQNDPLPPRDTADLAPDKRPHKCHADGCTTVVEPRFLMCPKHWGQVPRKLQDEVYKHYRPGQEADKQPSKEWSVAAKAAIAILRNPPPAVAVPEQKSLLEPVPAEKINPQKTAEPITVSHAVTLYRPWPYAVIHLGKDVENRDYLPSDLRKGDWFALHAGKRWDESAPEWIAELEGITPESIGDDADHPTGIVAVAEYLGHFSEGDRGMKSSSWLIGEPLVDSPWFTGSYGWKLGRVIEIPPVPCRGHQRVWELPDDVKAKVEGLVNGPAPTAEIEVVNVKADPKVLDDPRCAYIGRQMSYKGHFIHESPLKNPYKVGRDGTVQEVCRKFEEKVLWPALESMVGPVYEEIEGLAELHQLGSLDKVACWCVEPGKGNPCHGFSIVSAIKNFKEH